MTLSCGFSGNYPGDGIAPPLASQGDFPEAGQEKDTPISRVITKKSADPHNVKVYTLPAKTGAVNRDQLIAKALQGLQKRAD